MSEVSAQAFAVQALEAISGEAKRAAAAGRHCASLGQEEEAARWDAAVFAVERARNEVRRLAEECGIRLDED